LTHKNEQETPKGSGGGDRIQHLFQIHPECFELFQGIVSERAHLSVENGLALLSIHQRLMIKRVPGPSRKFGHCILGTLEPHNNKFKTKERKEKNNKVKKLALLDAVALDTYTNIWRGEREKQILFSIVTCIAASLDFFLTRAIRSQRVIF
jgi:hypothetical protein